jgi:transcriptional regulator with XRE-family HTH domain
MIDVTTYAPPSDSMAVFCEAVKARLSIKQISQGELAKRLGCTPTHVSKLLRGKAGNCSLETCDKIAQAMDTTLIELLMHGHD